MKKNTKYKLSASLICANMLDLKSDIKALENSGIDHIHFDVMDGNFVPRLGLHPEMLKEVKAITDIPVDVHLMIDNPIKYIPDFIKAGADTIIVHAESTKHLHHALKMVRDSGIKVGVALNIATPLNALDYVLDDIDLVLLMAINPGIVGHKLIPKTIDKISELKNKLINHKGVVIEIDGGVNKDSAPSMIKAGADILVCGSSSIFKKGKGISKQVEDFKDLLNNS